MATVECLDREGATAVNATARTSGGVSSAAVTKLMAALRFYVAHVVPIVGFGLLSSIGRAIQIGWAMSISLPLYVGLEIVVEGARLAIFLVIIGGGSLITGVETVKRVLVLPEEEREANFEAAWEAGKRNWLDVLVSVVVFALFAALVNTGIAIVAENPSVLAFVKRLGVGIGDEALRNAFVFFLKNATVIPFTIVWMYHGLYGYLVRDRRDQ